MSDEPRPGGPLWTFFRDVRRAVDEAHQGQGSHPYRSGDFQVHATAGDVEVTVRDVSEEDAVLIAAELAASGAATTVLAVRTCPSCQERVPAAEPCPSCAAPSPSLPE